MPTTPNPRVPSPVVIGGTGGSGTRLIAQVLIAAGVDLGDGVNDSLDALAFIDLYDNFVDPLLAQAAIDRSRFAAQLDQASRAHRAGRHAVPWGWKNPRSIFLLPLLDQALPGMCFVHVVRNGMDMATSSNQNQLRLHGRVVLGDVVDRLPETLASALLWRRVNLAAADYGRSMPGRYWVVRFEDVCADPRRALGPVLAALSLEPPDLESLRLSPPPARWKDLDEGRRAELRDAIGDALERFGYES